MLLKIYLKHHCCRDGVGISLNQFFLGYRIQPLPSPTTPFAHFPCEKLSPAGSRHGATVIGTSGLRNAISRKLLLLLFLSQLNEQFAHKSSLVFPVLIELM